MKNKYLNIIFGIIALSVLLFSCSKLVEPDDKNKIDIKGTLMNGDMKNPNIVATYIEKTLTVYFYDELGDCIVSVEDKHDSVIFHDTVPTYLYAATRFYMGDQPMGRYRLHITNGIDGAEGWFNNYKIVAVKP